MLLHCLGHRCRRCGLSRLRSLSHHLLACCSDGGCHCTELRHVRVRLRRRNRRVALLRRVRRCLCQGFGHRRCLRRLGPCLQRCEGSLRLRLCRLTATRERPARLLRRHRSAFRRRVRCPACRGQFTLYLQPGGFSCLRSLCRTLD